MRHLLRPVLYVSICESKMWNLFTQTERRSIIWNTTMMPKICEKINAESVSPAFCAAVIILSIALARRAALTKLTPGYWCGWGVTRVRVGWPLGTAGRRGGYMGYKNRHLSCMWEQESELDAVYRINCVGPESLFLVEWGTLSRWCPTPATALHCCPWSRNIHQLLSNSPDIVLQCSLAANTEGKQIIISIFSIWYLLSEAFNAMP